MFDPLYAIIRDHVPLHVGGRGWAGSIDELLLEAPRADDDCPMHLPDAPPAAAPWGQPPGARRLLDEEGGSAAVALPRHCSPTVAATAAPATVFKGTPVVANRCQSPLRGPTQKQHNQARMLASVNDVTAPDMHALSHAEATEWVTQEWDRFMLKIDDDNFGNLHVARRRW